MSTAERLEEHTGIEPESEQDSAGFRSLADTVALDPLRYVTSSVTGYDETVWADYLNFVWHVREGKLRAVPLLATEKERTG